MGLRSCARWGMPVMAWHGCVGYYGSNDTSSLNETSPTGRDYLAEVCRDWEAAAETAQTDRVVIVRTGKPQVAWRRLC